MVSHGGGGSTRSELPPMVPRTGVDKVGVGSGVPRKKEYEGRIE